MNLASSPYPEVDVVVADSPTFSLAVVDDHAIIRAIFKSIAEDAPDLRLTWTAPDLAAARQQLVKTRPHLLIVDVSLPDGDGFELTEQVLQTWPTTRVLMISMHDDIDYARRARDLGACGYVAKTTSPKNLLRVLQRICDGDEYFDGI
ncbi:response regulator transcription factor [Phragmitibacter flavus]|uniref:Response regulator transcription factor n=1 Tax=Phragmitibacter flavus TaxID=2576071 RepID=A0A5R8KAC7_9BACT|nr:response regulator transcription factor [Phragmitibacter flavus]TLD68489.1 response regulator transcription factor [Phragmitibacter flavus]